MDTSTPLTSEQKAVLLERKIYHNISEIPDFILSLNVAKLKNLNEGFCMDNLESWLTHANFNATRQVQILADNINKALKMDIHEIATYATFTAKCFPFMHDEFLDDIYSIFIDTIQIVNLRDFLLSKPKCLDAFFECNLYSVSPIDLASASACLLAAKDTNKNTEKWDALCQLFKKMMTNFAEAMTNGTQIFYKDDLLPLCAQILQYRKKL